MYWVECDCWANRMYINYICFPRSTFFLMACINSAWSDWKHKAVVAVCKFPGMQHVQQNSIVSCTLWAGCTWISGTEESGLTTYLLTMVYEWIYQAWDSKNTTNNCADACQKMREGLVLFPILDLRKHERPGLNILCSLVMRWCSGHAHICMHPIVITRTAIMEIVASWQLIYLDGWQVIEEEHARHVLPLLYLSSLEVLCYRVLIAVYCIVSHITVYCRHHLQSKRYACQLEHCWLDMLPSLVLLGQHLDIWTHSMQQHTVYIVHSYFVDGHSFQYVRSR